MKNTADTDNQNHSSPAVAGARLLQISFIHCASKNWMSPIHNVSYLFLVERDLIQFSTDYGKKFLNGLRSFRNNNSDFCV